MLMKLREVLTDTSDDGTETTLPLNITIFPNQVIVRIWWIAAIILLLSGWISYFSLLDRIKKKFKQDLA